MAAGRARAADSEDHGISWRPLACNPIPVHARPPACDAGRHLVRPIKIIAARLRRGNILGEGNRRVAVTCGSRRRAIRPLPSASSATCDPRPASSPPGRRCRIVLASTASMADFSASNRISLRVRTAAARRAPGAEADRNCRSSAEIRADPDMRMAFWITFSSSRMLPGKA